MSTKTVHTAFGTVAPAGRDAIPSQTGQRMKDIEGILGKAALDGSLTEQEMSRYIDEYKKLKTRTKVMGYSSNADSAQFNGANSRAVKGVGQLCARAVGWLDNRQVVARAARW